MATIKLGSVGEWVKKAQEKLNDFGYKLAVDGIFGKKTQDAVLDYQKNNGLGVDGIVGDETWGSLNGGTSSSENKLPTYTPFEATDFTYNDFSPSDDLGNLLENKVNAEDAVNNYGDFVWQDQAKYDEYIKNYENRPDFSYDLNGDALYQQYKDKYIKQGKMAMADTMGQAAAMTGGYGNSYASTAGNQAYQASLENLNDIVPELYQMAYDRYNQEGQDMLNMISLLGNERKFEYGKWSDGYNRLVADRDYAARDYDSSYDREYDAWKDGYDNAYQKWSDKTNIDLTNHTNAYTDAWKQAEFLENKRQADETAKLQREQFEWQKDQAEKSNTGNPADDDKDDDNPPQYTYEETDAVRGFVARIRTPHEFTRGSNPDREKYGTYKNYVKGMLEKYGDTLTDNDIATIAQKFGL